LTILVAVLALSAGAASAQDRPASSPSSNVSSTSAPAPAAVPAPAPRGVPVFTWTGFYVGGHVGYGGGDAETFFDPLPDAQTFINLKPVTLNPEPMGWMYGFHAGYNMPRGKWVFGVEGDYSWTTFDGFIDMSPFEQNNGAPLNGTLSVDQTTDWLSTIRGRAGWVHNDRHLIYGTAGVAFGKINTDALTDGQPTSIISYLGQVSGTRMGWTWGGGIEGALTEKVTWRAQYLVYNFGDEVVVANPTPAHPPFQIRYTSSASSSAVVGGISIKF
jgi:outer membrane immunogenic protein